MPLPMPRWVISSPIHISTAVPADQRQDDHQVAPVRGAVGQQLHVRPVLAAAEKTPPQPRPKMNVRPVACSVAMADGQVAGLLGDLALADRALLLQLLQLGDDHAEDLHDDAAP